MIKGSIQEEDITIINIYAPNIGTLQYVRQMLTSMKGEINSNTIIVGDFRVSQFTKYVQYIILIYICKHEKGSVNLLQ